MGQPIHSTLATVSASETFRLARQQREFLTFLVRRLEAKEPESFKESLLGIDFFARKAGYDPKADPIVRVEAHRLRRRLQLYYRTEGAEDAYRIELPRGSYVPALVATEAPDPSAERRLAVFVRTDDQLDSVGLTAEIVRSLGRLEGVRVFAVQSTLATQGDLKKAVSDLGASAVLECRVAGSRISAELKQAVPGGFEVIGSFDNQSQSAVDTVTMFVAATLHSALSGAKPKAHADLGDRETYQVYLSGRAWFHRFSPDNMATAAAHFQRVLGRYPNYAPALSGLADCHLLLGYWHAQNPRETLEQGLSFATRALEIDPDCADALCSLAAFQITLQQEWSLAEANFRRAIRLNPSNSLALNWLSIICLVPLGRFEEAIDAVFDAYDLDPVSPEIGNEIVWVRNCCGHFAESAEQGRRMVEQHKEFVEAYWSLGIAESALGHHDAARQAFEVAESLAPQIPHTLAWRGYIEGVAGNRAEALHYRQRLDELKAIAPVRSIHYSWIHAGLGEIDLAVDHFERAMHEADPFTLYADCFHVYDNLRDHPRFKKFRRDLNLP